MQPASARPSSVTTSTGRQPRRRGGRLHQARSFLRCASQEGSSCSRVPSPSTGRVAEASSQSWSPKHPSMLRCERGRRAVLRMRVAWRTEAPHGAASVWRLRLSVLCRTVATIRIFEFRLSPNCRQSIPIRAGIGLTFIQLDVNYLNTYSPESYIDVTIGVVM